MQELFKKWNILSSERNRTEWEDCFVSIGYDAQKLIWINSIDKHYTKADHVLLWDIDEFPFNQEYRAHHVEPGNVVLCSKSKDGAWLCYEGGFRGFLHKPLNIDKLKQLILKSGLRRDAITQQDLNCIRSLYLSSNKRLIIFSQSGFELIDHHELIKVVAERAYCRVHLLNGEVRLIAKPLSELEKELNSIQFFRSHISHLINLNALKTYSKIHNSCLILIDGSEVPLAARRKEYLEIALQKFYHTS